MATTKAELWDQLLYLVKILDQTYLFGASNTPNWVAMEESLQGYYEGQHVGQTQQQVSSLRSSLSGILARGASVLTPVLLELAKTGYAGTGASAQTALDEIRDGMVAATETVRERDFTFGSVSVGGSNVGSGVCVRTTMDETGQDLEGGCWPAGVTSLEVTQDFASGATKGRERVRIKGSGVTKTDELYVGTCPSEVLEITVQDATGGGNLIQNGGFESNSGTAGTSDTVFSGWTLSSQTLIDVESSTVLRGSYACEFLGNANILQYLTTPGIDTTKPVYLSLWFNRQSSCDGTLTLRLGSQTVDVALSAQSGWTHAILGSGASAKGWYDVFKEDSSGLGVRVQVTLASRTTGTLLLDDVCVFQPARYDGKFYAVIAGATEFLNGDAWTFTDSVANTGRTQSWLARLFGKHLPYAASGETYADK